MSEGLNFYDLQLHDTVTTIMALFMSVTHSPPRKKNTKKRAKLIKKERSGTFIVLFLAFLDSVVGFETRS